MDDEVWKDFIYNKDYQISNYGNFRSKDRVVVYKDGRAYNYKGQVVKPYMHRQGYLCVRTKVNRKVDRYFVHRIVAQHFLTTWDSTLVVDHVDNNPINNHVSNLQMITRVENILKGIYVDDNTRKAKIGYENACKIRVMHQEGESIPSLAAKYNVSYPTIACIIKGKTYNPKYYEGTEYVLADSKNIETIGGEEYESK